MWGYDEYIAKAKLYFGRSEQLEDDGDAAGATLWLLLGLEFLLRAPLAKVHPSMLAVPDGDSILHANGIVKKDSRPRSVPTKTVIERLSHVDPSFGQDRSKDASFLVELRNVEIHTADATLENVEPGEWMPRFLAVVEAICAHLALAAGDLLPKEVVDRATAHRDTADRAIRDRVSQAIRDAAAFYSRLTSEEVDKRKARSPLAAGMGLGDRYSLNECVACHEKSGLLLVGDGRTVDSRYDEGSQEIRQRVNYLAQSYKCRVCDLTLSTTAECMAAGFDRLHTLVVMEDRYEGWEEMLQETEYEYGND